MHVKAIGTKKSEILTKITFLGIFGQILPKTPIVAVTALELTFPFPGEINIRIFYVELICKAEGLQDLCISN